jgi:hypothetical protein
MSEYLGEEAVADQEARIDAMRKTLDDVDLQSKEISATIMATMQESDHEFDEI